LCTGYLLGDNSRLLPPRIPARDQSFKVARSVY
jgi:hypothetical protein